MKYEQLEKLVIQWAKDKGILEKATPVTQANKTLEEVHELLESVIAQQNGLTNFVNSKGKLVNTNDEKADAYGDILVTIIIGCAMQGLSLEKCLESAYNVISKRKGKIINGTFVKESDYENI